MSTPLLVANNITKKFGSCLALNNVNLTLEKGKIIGLLGPNGSGKSTFIKLCNGLLRPDNGNIFIDGHEIGIETKKIVSYLPERTYFDENTTPEKLITYFSDFYADFDVERAKTMLENMKIDTKKH